MLTFQTLISVFKTVNALLTQMLTALEFFMQLKAIAISLTALTVYAIHDALIKYVSSSLSVIQIVFFTAVFTFPLVSLWLVGTRQLPTLRPNNPSVVAFRSFSYVVIVVAAFYGFQTLPLAQAYALLFTTPMMVTALSAPMLAEKVKPLQWVAIVVGFAGVLWVLQPSAQPVSLGHIAALTAAVLSAINAVLVRKLGNTEHPVVLLLFPLIATAGSLMFVLPFVYEPMSITELGITGVIAALSLIAGYLTIVGYKLGQAAVIAPMQYSQIIWGVLFGLIFFGEVPQSHTFVGGAVVIGSGIFLVMSSKSGSAVQEEIGRRTTQTARLSTFLRRTLRDKF